MEKWVAGWIDRWMDVDIERCAFVITQCFVCIVLFTNIDSGVAAQIGHGKGNVLVLSISTLLLLHVIVGIMYYVVCVIATTVCACVLAVA
jgi:hypothetical protein